MCELLVKAIDAVHPNDVIDRRDCFKLGDIVVVRSDGHAWGTSEGPPKFSVVKLPGVPESDFLQRADDAEPEEYSASAVRAIPELRRAIEHRADRPIVRRRAYEWDAAQVAIKHKRTARAVNP